MTLRPITEAMRARNRKRVLAAAEATISGLWLDAELLHKGARQIARYGISKKDRRLLLEACGLRVYEAKPRTDAVPQVMASAYERPLGRNE